METGLHFLMQKTKNKISKTFVYQFETHFHIESSTDNITLDFHKSREKSYATLPNIVVHHTGNYSTLREDIVDY